MTKSSITSNIKYMTVMSFISQVITWSITIIVARILSPEDYGLVAVSGVFILFVSSVSEMGVGAAIIQRPTITDLQLRALYTVSIVIGVLMTLFGLACAPLFASFFNDPRLSGLISLQSISFLIVSCRSIQRSVLARETQFKTIALFDLISRVLTSIVTLLLAMNHFGYWAIAQQGVLIGIIQFILYSKSSTIYPTTKFSYKDIRDILVFGVQVLIRNMISQLYYMVDTFILGKIANASFVGEYSFSKQLANIPFEKIIGIVNNVLYPYLSRENSNIATIRAWTLKSADLQALTIVPFYILLYFCAEEAVAIILGPNWSGAVFPLKVFCISSIFKLAESYNINCLTALGKVTAQIRYLTLLFIVVGVSMLIFSFYLGPRDSVLVWITTYPVLSYLFVRILLRSINLRLIDVIKYMRTTLLAHSVMIIALFLISSFLHGSPWLTLSVKFSTGISLYACFLMIFDADKVRSLVSIFSSRRKSQN